MYTYIGEVNENTIVSNDRFSKCPGKAVGLFSVSASGFILS